MAGAAARSAHAGGRAAGATRPALGMVQRCLLVATTRRFQPARDVGLLYQDAFTDWEEAGWLLRAASPRNFVCWRQSRLILASDAPVAVFPDERFGLTLAQRALLSYLELLRRQARIGLMARGLPPAGADEPATIALLQQRAVRRLFGFDPDPLECARQFVRLEAMALEAVAGVVLPGGRPP
jgi:hypothetical protein